LGRNVHLRGAEVVHLESRTTCSCAGATTLDEFDGLDCSMKGDENKFQRKWPPEWRPSEHVVEWKRGAGEGIGAARIALTTPWPSDVFKLPRMRS